MEGTMMVARALVPNFFTRIHNSPLFVVTPSPSPQAVAPRRETTPASDPDTVKLLDLLTNRYHVGRLRHSSDSALELELPLTSHLHAGQRVRFVVSGREPLVSRQAMRGACITHVDRAGVNRLRVELVTDAEVAAA
jgi:hypothetical protein